MIATAPGPRIAKYGYSGRVPLAIFSKAEPFTGRVEPDRD
jgi:hypothetical protein